MTDTNPVTFKLWTIQRTDTHEFTKRDTYKNQWHKTPRMFTRKTHLKNHLRQSVVDYLTYRGVAFAKLQVVEYTLPVPNTTFEVQNTTLSSHDYYEMKLIPLGEFLYGDS